jgi:hypothetical protein
MNSKTNYDINEPPLIHSASHGEKASSVKVFTEGDALLKQFSPIAANRASIKKNLAKHVADDKGRQKRNPWTKEVRTNPISMLLDAVFK